MHNKSVIFALACEVQFACYIVGDSLSNQMPVAYLSFETFTQVDFCFSDKLN